MRLSILICTVFERSDNFAPILMREIRRQKHASKHKDVIELISLGDDCEMSIGEKRNKLLALAKGQYVSFIDDDDNPSPDYINEIFEGFRVAPNMDVYNFMVAYSDGREHKNSPVFYSIKYKQDKNNRDNFERLPNHLMVIKSSIAKSVIFQEIDKGEDTYWAREIQAKLKTEYCIPKTLYYYNWNLHTTIAQKR